MSGTVAKKRKSLHPEADNSGRSPPHPLMWVLAALIFFGGMAMFYYVGWF